MNYQSFVNNILADNGIEREIPVHINGRLTTTLGRAKFVKVKGVYRAFEIELSKTMLKTVDEKDIINIIKHECAHIIAQDGAIRDTAHGAYFKEICHRIGCSADKPYYAPKVVDYSHFKYVITCKNCGCKSGYSRKRDFFNVLPDIKCPKCGLKGSRILTQNW